MAYKKREKIGAPTKLDEDLHKKFVAFIEEGQYFETACSLCRITYQTFRRWMIKGSADESGIYRNFWLAVQEAEAKSERNANLYWQAHFKEDYRAARDWMDRRFRNKWGRKDIVELTGKDGGPIQTQKQDLSKLSIEELDALASLLKKTEDEDAKN